MFYKNSLEEKRGVSKRNKRVPMQVPGRKDDALLNDDGSIDDSKSDVYIPYGDLSVVDHRHKEA